MEIKISIKELESLLNQQKTLCRNQIEKSWRESSIVEELKKIDQTDRIINKFHEVRDPISATPFPNDFLVLKKYLRE